MHLSTRYCYRYIFSEIRYYHRSIVGLNGGDKLFQYVSKPSIKKPVPAWTRLANKIKDTELATDFSRAMHLEELRKVYDPEMEIGKLEDELQEEIASALGKTGRHCRAYFSLLEKLQLKYDKESNIDSKRLIASSFNEVRELAMDARRNLIIHRQAAGFTYQNHRIVEQEYPLPSKIPVK